MKSLVKVNKGHINKGFLEFAGELMESYILENVAAHYGISKEEAREELIDVDAEELPECITGDQQVRMEIFNLYQMYSGNNDPRRLVGHKQYNKVFKYAQGRMFAAEEDTTGHAFWKNITRNLVTNYKVYIPKA